MTTQLPLIQPTRVRLVNKGKIWKLVPVGYFPSDEVKFNSLKEARAYAREFQMEVILPSGGVMELKPTPSELEK